MLLSSDLSVNNLRNTLYSLFLSLAIFSFILLSDEPLYLLYLLYLVNLLSFSIFIFIAEIVQFDTQVLFFALYSHCYVVHVHEWQYPKM